MLAYGVAGVEPVDLVTGPGNVYVTAAKRLLRGVGRHRLRGRSERGGRARRRHRRPRARRRRPAQPGRARPDWRRPCWSPTRRRWPTRSSGELEPTRWRPPSTSERVTAALTGPQSGVVLVRDLEQGLAVVDAYGAEHLEIHDPGRGGGGPPGAQRRLRLRRPVLAGLARRLRRRVEPRAAHRRDLPAHRRAVGADLPARRERGGVRPGRAGRGGRARHRAGPRRGPAGARRRRRRPDRAGRPRLGRGPAAARRPARPRRRTGRRSSTCRSG